MNKDQVKGRIKQTEGRVKEVAGKTFGDKDLELKGKIKKVIGKTQADYGDLKSDVEKDS